LPIDGRKHWLAAEPVRDMRLAVLLWLEAAELQLEGGLFEVHLVGLNPAGWLHVLRVHFLEIPDCDDTGLSLSRCAMPSAAG
jgi:hypothetical protein